jgi:hypothetical protein
MTNSTYEFLRCLPKARLPTREIGDLGFLAFCEIVLMRWASFTKNSESKAYMRARQAVIFSPEAAQKALDRCRNAYVQITPKGRAAVKYERERREALEIIEAMGSP